jgi:hypothetical protein
MPSIKYLFLLLATVTVISCNSSVKSNIKASHSGETVLKFDTTYKVIHVSVALCDNKYQGIVPVPAVIGNGQDPDNNLYWGNAYGVKTFFKRSAEWKLIKAQKLDNVRLERLIFRHVKQKYYLVADAYDGQYIKKCIVNFLNSSNGRLADTLKVESNTIGIDGNAKLRAYIGHNGLMDFQLADTYASVDSKKRDCIVLACKSRQYFGYYLRSANINPLVWTTGLMCPEAYTLHDAINGYIKGETNENVRTRAALAYDKYQKSGIDFAKALLVTGR